MPIRWDDLVVLEAGINKALAYLQNQSDETWGKEDSDPQRSETVTMLDRALNIVRHEKEHIAKVEHNREIRKLGLKK